MRSKENIQIKPQWLHRDINKSSGIYAYFYVTSFLCYVKSGTKLWVNHKTHPFTCICDVTAKFAHDIITHHEVIACCHKSFWEFFFCTSVMTSFFCIMTSSFVSPNIATFLGTVRKFPHLPKYGHARILLRPPLPPQNTGKLGNCLNVTDTCSSVIKKGKVKV